MMIELYYLLTLISILLGIGALTGKNKILGVLSMACFFSLAAASMYIEMVECGTSCSTVAHSDYGLAVLFLAFGITMFYLTFMGYMELGLSDGKKLWNIKW